MARNLDELFNSSRFQWAQEGLAYVLKYVRVWIPRRSGLLAKETERRSTLRGAGDGFTIRHGKFYGHILDVAGRKAYTIVARKLAGRSRGKSALRFTPKSGGIRFARKVSIPKMTPTRFMRDAVDAAEPGVRALAEKHMANSLNSTILNRVIRLGLR